MTRDEARKILEEDGNVKTGHWRFYRLGWHCDRGCCDVDFDTTEEVLDEIEFFMDSWDDVKECD